MNKNSQCPRSLCASASALLVCLLIAAVVAPVSAETAHGITPFKAEYRVENNYITGGIATLSLTPKDSGGFDFVLQSKPTGVFKWTGNGNIREHAVLPSLNSPFESTQYDYNDKGKPKRNYRVDFDREAGQFEMQRGNESNRYPLQTGVVDRLSVTLALLHKLKQDPNFESMQLQVLDGSTAETLTYSNHGIEPISTAIGKFDANRILKDRVNSNRETIIWLAEVGESNTVLPLKIEQYKRDKLTLRLIISNFTLIE